jgi:predicted HicB family RNase H-like nuclease
MHYIAESEERHMPDVRVTITPELHRLIKLCAVYDNMHVNQAVTTALQRYVAQHPIASLSKDMPTEHKKS